MVLDWWRGCIVVAAAAACIAGRFGTRARGIKNKVAVNTRLSPEVLQQQLAKANAQVSLVICMFTRNAITL